MPQIDPVVLQLRADMDKYRRDLRATTSLVQNSLGRQERQFRNLESQVRASSGQIGNSLRGLAATFGTAFSVRQIGQIVDSFTRLQNNLRVAGQEGEALAQVQSNLLSISQQYGVNLETLSSVFLKASLAQNELGASTEQIINLNEIVAASLKITGTSAEQARGALLQLGQALGADIVRGEEFNSLLENALPLVQAAARGIDRFEGSVARLRGAVVEGNVTSREFFEGILRGGVQTIEDAEKANLTLSGSFEALSSSLTVYIGEGAAANGITEALSSGIITLANNIDTLATALTIIAVLMGTRFVASAIAARAALAGTAAQMGVVGAASFALQARLAGAATGMQAMAFAGRGLLATLGGPLGLAIGAVTIGLTLMSSEAVDARKSVEELETSAKDLGNEADTLRAELESAGVAVDDIGRAADVTKDKVDDMSAAFQRAERRAASLSKQLGELAFQQSVNRVQQANQNLADARLAASSSPSLARSVAIEGGDTEKNFENAVNNSPAVLAAQREVNAAKELRDLNLARLKENVTRFNNGSDLIGVSPSSGGVTRGGGQASGGRRATGGGGGGSGAADRAARDASQAARVQQQFNAEIESLGVERLEAIAQITGSATDRAMAEQARLVAEQNNFVGQLQLDEELTAAEKEQLIAARKAADIQRSKLILLSAQEQLQQEKLAIESGANQGEQERVRARGEIEDRTARQRLETEQRLITLQFSQERAQQEAVLASEKSTQVERYIAAAQLERLDQLEGLAREAARLRNQSPLGQFIDGIARSEAEINEDLESIAVEGLQNLGDGITDVITGAESLGDVFSNLADSIIRDLIRIAVQQAIIKPLAESLGGSFGGGSGGGGLGSIFGSLFGGGRASGGPVEAGKIYRVGEAGPENIIMGGNGRVVSAGQSRAMTNGGSAGPVTVRLVVRKGEMFDASVEQISGDMAVRVVTEAAPAIVEQATNETFRQSSRPRL